MKIETKYNKDEQVFLVKQKTEKCLICKGTGEVKDEGVTKICPTCKGQAVMPSNKFEAVHEPLTIKRITCIFDKFLEILYAVKIKRDGFMTGFGIFNEKDLFKTLEEADNETTTRNSNG